MITVGKLSIPQSQVIEHLANSTVLVLPSVVDPEGGMDNLPTVIMEAMAAGLPVVSTAIGGLPEMIIENEIGALVSPSAPAALAHALGKVIVDLPLARRLGENGRKWAEELFSIEKNAQSLVRLIEQIA